VIFAGAHRRGDALAVANDSDHFPQDRLDKYNCRSPGLATLRNVFRIGHFPLARNHELHLDGRAVPAWRWVWGSGRGPACRIASAAVEAAMNLIGRAKSLMLRRR